MDALYIAQTKVTPSIVFDAGKGEFKITGRSIPADATVFFLPADRWAEKFAAQFTGNHVTIDIMLDHLNTGSVRSILSILTKFTRMKSTGKNVTINWHYDQEDEDIRDKGEEMSMILDHPFGFVPHKVA